MERNESYNDRILFDEEVEELVNVYLNDAGSYHKDSVIAVHKATNKILLTSPDKVDHNWKTYIISNFIRENEDDAELEVNTDATHDLACSFIFVP